MKTMISAFLVLCLCGCEYSSKPRTVTPVHSYNPEIYSPPRPIIEKISGEELDSIPEPVRKKVIFNHDALNLYARQQESSISSYNDYARKHNKSSAEALGKNEAEGKKETTP